MTWRRMRVLIPATIVVREDLLRASVSNMIRLDLEEHATFESVGNVDVIEDMGEATEFNEDGSRRDIA